MVLERTRVAGYDAAVLAANDPAALNRWLGEHGYESRPALTAWLEPYTKGNWTVTAFRIATIDTTRPGIATTAVRMTFPTDRPFFPYREPEDQRIESANPPPPRLLRTFFVGNGRHGGRLGGNQIWPGTTVWANVLPEKEPPSACSKGLKLPLPARCNRRARPNSKTATSPRTPSTADSTLPAPRTVNFYPGRTGGKRNLIRQDVCPDGRAGPYLVSAQPTAVPAVADEEGAKQSGRRQLSPIQSAGPPAHGTERMAGRLGMSSAPRSWRFPAASCRSWRS